jgi:hypothetical protein
MYNRQDFVLSKKHNFYMKKYYIFLILTLSILIISCSSEERILQKDEYVSLLQFPTEKIEINNYEDSGIDFIITPVTATNFQKAKIIASDSANSHNQSLYVYEISTKYPEKTEPFLTTIAIQPNKDGSMTSTHFIGDIVIATLKYDNQGNIVDVIIPEENFMNATFINGKYFSKQSLSYSCINKEYQKIKASIEKDMVNDITCDLIWPICRTLIIMNAIENCR